MLGSKGFRIAWNRLNPNYILASCSDKKAYLLSFDESNDLYVKQTYSHGTPVYGIDWNNFEPTRFATGSDNGLIKVFDILSEGTSPELELKGHFDRVFNITWNPHSPNIIASGSNDKSVRVWNTVTGESKVLEKHQNYVRALAWSYEIPWFLASGSWDAKICIWDTRYGVCLTQLDDHHADIYGLDAHPDRPFVFASCSRDNSIRLWNSESLVNNFKIKSILKHSAEQLIQEPDDSMILPDSSHQIDFTSVTKMCGKRGRSIFQNADYDDKSHYLDQMMEIFDFFSLYDGQNECCDLLRLIVKNEPGSLHNRVLHVSDISCAVESHAKELTKSKSLKIKGQFGKKEDRKRKGAELYLKLGNYKEFCEIMMELGEFDRAIAFAPAVSMAYWKKCMQKYGEWLETHEERFTEAPLPYIAINEIDTAIEMLKLNEEYEDSKLVRALKVAGVYQDIMAKYEEEKKVEAIDHETALKTKEDLNKDEQLVALTKLQADQYFRAGHPILSACSYLSIDDYKGALIELVRSNELFLAYILANLLYPVALKEVTARLSRKAERNMMIQESIELASNSGPLEKAFLVNRLSKQGLYELEEYEEEKINGAALEGLESTLKQIVKELLSGNTQIACEMCITQFDECLQSSDFSDLTTCIQAYEYLQNFQIMKVPLEIKARVFAHSSIIGICKAIYYNFGEITPGLYSIYAQVQQQIPKIEKFFETIMTTIYSHRGSSSPLPLSQIEFSFEDEYSIKLFGAMLGSIREVQKQNSRLFDKPADYHIVLTGSNLPSKVLKHKKRQSILSNWAAVKCVEHDKEANKHNTAFRSIFKLESGPSYDSACYCDEAIEWAIVYGFSPILNGNILNPY